MKIRPEKYVSAIYIKDCTKHAIFLSRATLSFLTSVVCLSLASGQGDTKYIRQGNGKYSDEKYQESEILYRKALNADKMSGKATFNLGDALYRQNKYDEAGKQFAENAEKSKDDLKKADSYYNLGNSFLKGKKLKESIEAYKNSLRFNPENQQAKYNLAYAQDLLKMQEKQQQQQQDQGDNKQQDKDKDNKDQKQNKDQDKQDQQKQKDSQSQQQQQQQISREDAQRLLDALANDEKQVQEKVKEAKAAKARVKTLRNW